MCTIYGLMKILFYIFFISTPHLLGLVLYYHFLLDVSQNGTASETTQRDITNLIKLFCFCGCFTNTHNLFSCFYSC